MQNVRGAKEYSEGKSSDIKGLRVINDRTPSRKSCWKPIIPFLLVSSPVLGVVSRNTAEKMGKDYGQKDTLVVGTGPFSLSNWGSDQITLVKNNKYKGTPPVKSLQFIVTGNQQEINNCWQMEKNRYIDRYTPLSLPTLSAKRGKER